MRGEWNWPSEWLWTASNAGVPNPFDTRDWFFWRLFFYRLRLGRMVLGWLKDITFFVHFICHPQSLQRVRHNWATNTFSLQFSSVALSCLTLCDPTRCSTPGLPVHHQLPEPTQTHDHWVRDAVQPTILSSVVPFSSCPQSYPASETLQMSQLFAWGGQVLEFQLQHQSYKWTPRTDLL